jgi:hypothetical protein
MKQAVTSWLWTIDTDFLYAGIQILVPWRDKCFVSSDCMGVMCTMCHVYIKVRIKLLRVNMFVTLFFETPLCFFVMHIISEYMPVYPQEDNTDTSATKWSETANKESLTLSWWENSYTRIWTRRCFSDIQWVNCWDSPPLLCLHYPIFQWYIMNLPDYCYSWLVTHRLWLTDWSVIVATAYKCPLLPLMAAYKEFPV